MRDAQLERPVGCCAGDARPADSAKCNLCVFTVATTWFAHSSKSDRAFRCAVRPRNGGAMFRYRLHLEGGSGGGDATYSVMIQPAEEEDESPFVGLLQVEAA
jgi:hypothetical protein